MSKIKLIVRESGRNNPVPVVRQVLDQALVESICAANDAFIGQFITPPTRLRASAQALPTQIIEPLSQLDRVERRRIAAMPFTLFSMRFTDAAYWRNLLDRPSLGSRRAAAGDAVARTAVFLAWHLVQASPATAGMAMGMSADVASIFQWIPLYDVERLGALANPALTPRWPTTLAFWHQLLAAAKSTQAVDGARFFGLQLLAAECLPERRSRPRD